MPRYRMTIAYEGTHYAGWQVQPNGLSIQQVIETALSQILQKRSPIVGSGRTDSGVHALGQVAHFDVDAPIDPPRLLHSLNGLLPLDIRILSLEESAPDFHARFTAKRKIYHYHLQLTPIRSPFVRQTTYQLRGALDLGLLQQACARFVGTHDFRTFTNQAHAKRSTVRTLYRLDMHPEEGGLRLEFEGNGFLYKMVRNIVGTLIDIGQKRTPLNALDAIFESGDRSLAGQAAPASGLFLYRVIYETN